MKIGHGGRDGIWGFRDVGLQLDSQTRLRTPEREADIREDKDRGGQDKGAGGAKAGYASAATSLATSYGLSALLLNIADVAASNNMSPDVGGLSRSVIGLLYKLRGQGPLRLDGVLKWDRCECVGGRPKWVKQSDITDSDDVPIENLGVPTAYVANFKNTYKQVERGLIRKMINKLKGGK